MITKEQANTKLLTLSQKADESLHIYHRQIETLFIGISRKYQMTHDREKAIILNNAEQYILKDTITKFGFGLKFAKLHLHIIEYKAKPMCSLYRTFKKPRRTLIYRTPNFRCKKNLNLNMVVRLLNPSRLQLLLSKIFDSAHIKPDHEKLTLINPAYDIEIENKSSAILVIRIVVKTYTSLKICIHYMTLKFHKVFIILIRQSIYQCLLFLPCITHI